MSEKDECQGTAEDYNSLIADYNDLVERYNDLLDDYNDLTDDYISSLGAHRETLEQCIDILTRLDDVLADPTDTIETQNVGDDTMMFVEDLFDDSDEDLDLSEYAYLDFEENELPEIYDFEELDFSEFEDDFSDFDDPEGNVEYIEDEIWPLN